MTVMEWATIASLATAAGTLVLALATFASVRSGNRSARAADRAARTGERSARIAERSLLAGQRPLLVNSRGRRTRSSRSSSTKDSCCTVPGGGAEVEVTDAAVYMAISVRNVGTGLAVMHGWHVGIGLQPERTHPPLEDLHHPDPRHIRGAGRQRVLAGRAPRSGRRRVRCADGRDRG